MIISAGSYPMLPLYPIYLERLWLEIRLKIFKAGNIQWWNGCLECARFLVHSLETLKTNKQTIDIEEKKVGE